MGKVFSKGHRKTSGNQDYMVGTLAHEPHRTLKPTTFKKLFSLMCGQRILPLGKIKSKRSGMEWREVETLSQRLKGEVR